MSLPIFIWGIFEIGRQKKGLRITPILWAVVVGFLSVVGCQVYLLYRIGSWGARPKAKETQDTNEAIKEICETIFLFIAISVAFAVFVNKLQERAVSKSRQQGRELEMHRSILIERVKSLNMTEIVPKGQARLRNIFKDDSPDERAWRVFNQYPALLSHLVTYAEDNKLTQEEYANWINNYDRISRSYKAPLDHLNKSHNYSK